MDTQRFMAWRFLGVLLPIAIFHVAVCHGAYGGLAGTSQATWYGEAEGDGTDAGACGYGALSLTPYKAIIVAGSAPLYQNGLGCGSCYQVKCTNALCSSTSVTVVVTDLCPGGDFCGGGKTHFDLSGTAFGALALPGKENALRAVGVLDISYERSPCPYASSSLSLRILPGFNSFYVGLVPLGGNGPGSVSSVAFKQANSAVFTTLTKDWGASFFLLSSSPLSGPFTVKLTASATGEIITCPKTIPSTFTAGTLYDCGAQFSSGGTSSQITPTLPDPSPPPSSPPPTSFPPPTSSPPTSSPSPSSPPLSSPPPRSSSPPPSSAPLSSPPTSSPPPSSPPLSSPPRSSPPPSSPPLQSSPLSVPKIPPPSSPSPKTPPAGAKVVISQTLVGSYLSDNGKMVAYHYSVNFKNVGDKPVNTLIFVAENFNPIDTYNIVSLGANTYTLPSYVFPLGIGASYAQFGYHIVGGPGKFTILSQS